MLREHELQSRSAAVSAIQVADDTAEVLTSTEAFTTVTLGPNTRTMTVEATTETVVISASTLETVTVTPSTPLVPKIRPIGDSTSLLPTARATPQRDPSPSSWARDHSNVLLPIFTLIPVWLVVGTVWFLCKPIDIGTGEISCANES